MSDLQHWRAGIAVVAWAIVLAPAVASGQPPVNRPAPVKPRARPPAKWDAASAGHFYVDAFVELEQEGPRPDFTKAAKAAAAAVADGGSPGTARPAGESWSAFVSPDTLVDEIKSKKTMLDAAVAKKGSFIRGGYIEARNALSSIAAAFAVIAASSGDVRWKEQSPQARDAFGRVAADCNKGDDQTFVAATKAAEDLGKLLTEGTISGQVSADVKWHRIAARTPLMWRLEQAEKAIREATASQGGFTKQADRLVHEAEIVALIGEFVQQPEFEYFDDDSYRGYASAMRDAAAEAAAAARKGDYDAATAAIGRMSTACTECHGEYR